MARAYADIYDTGSVNRQSVFHTSAEPWNTETETLPINHQSNAERVERALQRKAARINAMLAVFDNAIDSGRAIPTDVQEDFRAIVQELSDYADYWGFDASDVLADAESYMA